MGTGQTLVVGAVIFASILLLASFPSGPDITGQTTNTRQFAANALEKSAEAFNREIEQNKSIKHAKREIYQYNRFIERLSSSKGQQYSSFQLIVLPEEEKAAFVNYQGRDANITLDLGDEQFNSTIEESQFKEYSYTKDGSATSVNITLRNYGREYSFYAASPRILSWMRFESNDETWVNSITG
jgi:hypothetical protein